MNTLNLTKSPSQEQIFVGDMGSRPENESQSTVTVTGAGGDPEGFKARCLDKIKGMTIMSQSIAPGPDGKLIFTARVKSVAGLPGSHVPGRNLLAGDFGAQFTGVKFLGIKDGKVEFVKLVKNRIRHFKGELDSLKEEAVQMEELWIEAHSMFSAMARFDIA